MTMEYLRWRDVNVVVVGWLAGSGPPYTQCVANARLLGAMLGRFILNLQVRKVLKRGEHATVNSNLCPENKGVHSKHNV